MMNRKPETSLQEDLKVLGLLSGDAKRALSEEAGDPTESSGDEDEDGEKDGDADDEKAEKKHAKDEKKRAKKPVADDDDGDEDADDKKAMPSAVQDMDGKMSYTEQLESAWDVVRNYYKLGESDDAGLGKDDLRTVIDAFAFIMESWENDGGKPKAHPDGHAGEQDVPPYSANENPVTQKAYSNSPTSPEWKKDKYGERGRAGSGKSPAAPRQQMAQTQAEGLDALVGELREIKSAVEDSGPSSEQLALSERLIEGFEAVRDTAGEVASRINQELAESENVSDGDARVEATTFFESICNDATEILTAIAEGNVEISDAAEDLNTISHDLKKGLAGLKNVD